MRHARGLILALLVPGLLFCAISGARRGVCLESYSWDSTLGYRPTKEDCAGEEKASVFAAAGFYARSLGGLATGRSGRSREDASRSLASLIAKRGGRSLAILGIACLGLLVIAGLGGGLTRLQRRAGEGVGAAWLRKLLLATPPLAPPGGLPLPLAGMLVFVVVVRVVPARHALDYDSAGLLWAGIALALADGAAAVLLRGLRHTLAVERGRPYAEALNLWGKDPGPAARHVSRRVRASQVRGALLALLGGLLVVEGVFGVNGLGETLRDLVVDRRGLDPLLLTGVLLSFSLFVLLVEWLPLEQALGRRP